MPQSRHRRPNVIFQSRRAETNMQRHDSHLAHPLPPSLPCRRHAAAATTAGRSGLGQRPARLADTRRHAAWPRIRFDLAPGWKTYWRSPGDAGIPPLFNWSGSENLASVPPALAASACVCGERHADHRLQERACASDRTDADRSVAADRLHAEIDMGVCSDICVPAAVELSCRSGPIGRRRSGHRAGAGGPTATAARSRSGPHRLRRSSQSRTACASPRPCALPPTGGRRDRRLRTQGRRGLGVRGSRSSARAARPDGQRRPGAENGAPFALDRSALTVTVLGSDSAVEIVGCPAP